jgi:hypothetical protein
MEPTYYLDESGSSGDLVKAGDSFDFAQQPVFALACIGVYDMPELENEIKRLKAQHRVQSAELKSTAVKNKPAFVTEMATYLRLKRLPVFIEIVDKRFFFCMNMVSHLILPAGGPIDHEPETMWIRNVFAEYLHAELPKSVMQAYVDACDERSLEATGRAYDTLLSWLQDGRDGDEIAGALRQSVANSRMEFDALASQQADAWRAGLPIPDQSKRGKLFWMLPNLSSFTNIYARINLFHDRVVGGLTLVHDEQEQYDQILSEGKITAEKLLELGMDMPLAHADYAFTQQASLIFRRSADCVGIQAADVLAGFVGRYVQANLDSAVVPNGAHSEALRSLLNLSEPMRGTGINFVLAQKDIDRMGISTTPGFRLD